MNIKNWIKKVEDEIEMLKNCNPDDRLDYITYITKCNNAIMASAVGLNEWLKNSAVMNEFSKEEINNMFKEFSELSIKYLEFDIKWTKILSNKFNIKDTEELGIDEDEDEEISTYIPSNNNSNKDYIS